MTENLNNVEMAQVIAEVQRLSAPDEAAGDRFGFKVAVSGYGDTMVVAACSTFSCTGAAYVFARKDQQWTYQAKLTPFDSLTLDGFGCAVAVTDDGDTVLVGASNNSELTDGGGAVYVFSRFDGIWTMIKKLTPISNTRNSHFGSSLAITGDGRTLAVGAYYGSTGEVESCGLAYIFNQNQDGDWIEGSKLHATDASWGAMFGISICINDTGDVVAVGASGDSKIASNSGAAYVFTHKQDEWTQQIKLVASDAKKNMQFGRAIAISDLGTTLVIGAHGAFDLFSHGTAYVFTKTGVVWTRQAKLSAKHAVAQDGFGIAVALAVNGNKALIGAWGNDAQGEASGAAYVFTRRSLIWGEDAELLPCDGSVGKNFGGSVAMDKAGSVMLVGSQSVTNENTSAGAAYIFK